MMQKKTFAALVGGRAFWRAGIQGVTPKGKARILGMGADLVPRALGYGA